MRTFLIALVCSVAAFFGGIATVFYIATNDTGPPAFSSPGSAYWHWVNAKNMVVKSTTAGIRSDESIRSAATLGFLGQTQALLLVFDKLTADQVADAKRSVPFLVDAVPANYKAMAEVMAACIAKANVGDNLVGCHGEVSAAHNASVASTR